MTDHDFEILEQTIRQEERNKVIEEIGGWLDKMKYSEPPLLGTPETTERLISAVNNTLEDLRTKLNQLKGGKC